MRAREFIIEAGEYNKGYQFVDKMLSPEKWTQGSKFSKDYEVGKDKVSKVLNPLRWFEKKPSTDTNTAKEKPEPKQKLAQHTVRQTVQNLAAGRTMFRQDLQTLNTLLQQVKSGDIQIKVDQTQLERILKSAIKQQTLSDDDKNILSQVADQLR